jgi:hypothetical protein
MSLISKPLIVLLLAAVAILPLAAQAFPVADPPTRSPAGCHSDLPQPASPAPAQHFCCHAGHSTAIVQKSLLSQPIVPPLAAVVILDSPLAVVAQRVPSAGPFILLGDPPKLLPLRI